MLDELLVYLLLIKTLLVSYIFQDVLINQQHVSVYFNMSARYHIWILCLGEND